jgi:alcohol dehydrogenase class IV
VVGLENSDSTAGSARREDVVDVRDTLGLPGRLRDVNGPDRENFRAIAEAVLADPFMRNAPDALAPTVEDIETVLEDAW